MRMLALIPLIATVALLESGASLSASTGSVSSGRGMPTTFDVRSLLDGATHFSEFVEVPAEHTNIQAYVSYPDRADKAPVVLVSDRRERMTDWLRAVGAQLSREGFIAVVPDSAYGSDGNAVRAYAAALPAASGTTARLDISREDHLIAASTNWRQLSATFDQQGWTNAVAFLRAETHNRYVAPAVDIHSQMLHAEHAQFAAAQAGSGGRGRGAEAGGESAMAGKRPDLPPHINLAPRTLATSPRKSEWVDIPMGTAKLHTFISYPAGSAPAPIVVVVHGAGYGFNDWVRSTADQLAQEGFIALAPDLLSGFGPKGGNTDSFQFPDEITQGMGKLGPGGGLERVKTVRNYGMKLSRANGKSAVLGYCFGGGQAFLMTAEPGVNAGVVFYGGPPSAEVMAKITAPVIGFYGEDDARLTASVEPTVAAMKKMGKSYEPHIYRNATHAFLQFQDLAENFAATADAWPRAIAFLKEHTR